MKKLHTSKMTLCYNLIHIILDIYNNIILYCTGSEGY